jgi:hypothetical protein
MKPCKKSILNKNQLRERKGGKGKREEGKGRKKR